MAKQTSGINGGFNGKVGTVVGYQWRGEWVMRALPHDFHDAKSERQLEQRGRFKASVGFAARLRDILILGLRQVSQKAHKTEYNYFQMINNDCLAWDGESLVVDYPNLKLSEGPVAPVGFSVFSEATQDGCVSQLNSKHLTLNTITIPFEKNPEHRNCNSNDKVYVAAVNAVRCEAVLSLPVYRRMRSVTIELPVHWEGEEVHLYGFVQDLAGRASESCYIGEWSVVSGQLSIVSGQLADATTATDQLTTDHRSLTTEDSNDYFSSSRTFSMSSSSPPGW